MKVSVLNESERNKLIDIVNDLTTWNYQMNVEGKRLEAIVKIEKLIAKVIHNRQQERSHE
jgi:hypothetical protein